MLALLLAGLPLAASAAPPALILPLACAPALVFYAEVFGVSAGDALELRLTGPDGATLAERRVPIARRLARRFACIGVRRTAASWKPGVYRGEARLVHAGGGRSPASIQAASVEVRE